MPPITSPASCSAGVRNTRPARPSARRLRRSIQERGSPCVTRECVTRWRVPIPGSRNGRNAARMRKDFVNTTRGDAANHRCIRGLPGSWRFSRNSLRIRPRVWERTAAHVRSRPTNPRGCLYTAFMPRQSVFITSSRDGNYGRRMALDSNTASVDVEQDIRLPAREMKTLSGRSQTILIFGDAGPQAGEARAAESNRVPVETIKANLKTAMESVGELVRAARESVGDLHVCHVDVEVAIASDGSVGLLGAGANAGARATLTVRVKKVIPGSRRYP